VNIHILREPAFLSSFLMIGIVSIIVVPMRNLNLGLYQRIGIIFESMPCVDTTECDELVLEMEPGEENFFEHLLFNRITIFAR